MISKHPLAALVMGIIVLACFGTLYSILAAGVCDGPGHLTAQFMLATSIVAALTALLIVGRSAWALFVQI